MNALEFADVSFRYEEDAPFAIRHLNFTVEEGAFVAVLGHNGSGKSTLARLSNGLLEPDEGKISVFGQELTQKNLFDVRRNVGVVFQNPDNQTVATIVEDDVAFGAENIGLAREEIGRRIAFALKAVGMERYRSATVARLSGGQKQRVAIAGVIAMRPDCLILDEATAMLDPRGRKAVMDTIRQLRAAGISIVSITHYMEEAAQADRVLVMSHGRIVMEGTPEQVFSQTRRLQSYHLDVPQAAELRDELAAAGLPLPEEVITPEACAQALYDLLK